MRILLWHVHGSWTTAFVQGPHEYVVPVTPDRGPDGRGRARTWDWPDTVREATPKELAELPFDLMLLQRPSEVALAERWTGRRPGSDAAAVYLEHNAPDGRVPLVRHPLADQTRIPIVHVTHFNDVFWDNGRAPHEVIEHGVIDPGPLYTGELARQAVVANDPLTRGRTLGTDLIPRFAALGGLDLFGMRVTGAREHFGGAAREGGRLDLGEYEDLPQSTMHRELARRRVYLHLTRWTSLGLSLIEAMTIGMPVVVLATTEAVEAVPREAGELSTDVERLRSAAQRYLHDPDAARAAGTAARRAALDRYGLSRFLTDWDALMKEVVR
jgi:hypothetical protein